MARIAVIGCILEDPRECQSEFNDVVASFRGSMKGRMGIPFEGEISVISLTVVGEVDDKNTLTGKLGNISGVTVKTAIAKKEI